LALADCLWLALRQCVRAERQQQRRKRASKLRQHVSLITAAGPMWVVAGLMSAARVPGLAVAAQMSVSRLAAVAVAAQMSVSRLAAVAVAARMWAWRPAVAVVVAAVAARALDRSAVADWPWAARAPTSRS
jgi:hypothetical protein